MSDEAKNPVPLGEIEHGPSKMEQFMEKNLKMVLLLGFLVAVGVAVFIVMRQLGDDKARKAGEALVAAEDVAGYESVAEKFPDTPSAVSAMLLKADQQWTEGREDESIQTLRSIISDHGDHPVAANARFALATSLLSQGKADEAKGLFEQVLADEDAKAFHALTLISLGDIAKAAGDDEKAKEYYNRKIDDYKGFPDQNLATQRLSLVGVEEPEKVDPPAAPEPAADAAPQLTPPSPIQVAPVETETAPAPVDEAAPEGEESPSDAGQDLPVDAGDDNATEPMEETNPAGDDAPEGTEETE